MGQRSGFTSAGKGRGLDQLIDAAHAAIQQQVAQSLTDIGWVVQAEVSFNHYGDRGRVDIVALHSRTRLVLIVELKSALGDLQETIGRLDVKVRLGRRVAAEVGWTSVDGVVGALVIGDSRAARRVVATHEALFRRFSLRGRWALAWIRRPSGGVPSGLLWFVDRTDSRRATRRR